VVHEEPGAVGGPGTVAVVGAGGRTGRLLVPELRAAGRSVRAVVRRPEAWRPPEGVEVVRADALEPESLDGALADVDAVVSLIGVSRLGDVRRTGGLFTTGGAHLRAAATAARVPRLVLVSSLGVVDSPRDPWSYRVAKRVLLDRMYRDMEGMEAAAPGPGPEVVVVRAPRLTDGRATGHYRLSGDADPPGRRTLSRADLAAALARVVLDPGLTGVLSVTGR
jgi:uncharacterized protein YbjT (DUF2867 family)